MQGLVDAPTRVETPVAGLRAPLAALSGETYAIHYGNARMPLVWVVPDDTYPNMWRMIWPDSEQSDMANLARIKDAAFDICDRGPPRRDRRRLKWKHIQ
jgi:hypothetical protein